MNMEPKVICIGWHKTGTTTLGDALLTLGYNVVGARLDLAESLLKNDTSRAINLAQQFTALQDVPWNALYKELDEKYPGSKFILTIRNEDKWLLSAQKHFRDNYSPMREWLYGNGVLKGNEELYINRFRKHYEEVSSYFKGRENDLLIMDLSQGDNWDKLCDFLKKPKPNKVFPHSNKGRHQFTFKDRLIFRLKNSVPMPIRELRLSLLKALGKPDPRHRFNNREGNQKVRNEINAANINKKQNND